MSEIEKLPLTSMNIVDDQLQKLKELFPETFTEGNKIDWDKLRLTLGETIDAGKERYGMNWPGKADCFKTIQQPSIATLVPARDESIDFDTTENLFIEGDNLEVLKLLQKSYLGKVKMICIDPPYNTGNEFIYPDNYSENLQTYLEYTGQIDYEGRKFGTNTDTDGRFHSKWMNMMYPRLFLAKNLLLEDGVIFISIDDNEVHNLRALCNEIFGEENFVAVFPWKKRTAKSDVPFGVSQDYEWIVSYTKGNLNAGIEFERKYYSTDDYPNDRWRLSDITTQRSAEERPNSAFVMIDPKTDKQYPFNPNRIWGVTKDTFQDYYDKGKIVFPDSYSFLNISIPAFRVFESEDKVKALKKFGSEEQKKAASTFLPKEVGMSEDGNKEIIEMFGSKIFSFPKPHTLIKHFISIINCSDSIILDFFAGSGTLAHAVFEQNKEYGGSRKFICVQLPEPTDEKSEAFKAGYKHIAGICKERIRQVIIKINKEVVSLDKQRESLILKMAELSIQIKLEEDKVPANMFGDEKTNKAIEKLKSEFQVFELKAQEILEKYNRANEMDKGFKVFKLQPSNFKIWDANISKDPEVIQKSLFEHIAHINPESTQEAILYELLLKSGFELTTHIEKLSIEGKTVFSIAKGELLICLEHDLTNDLIKSMAELQPTRVICLDEGFHNNDQLKTNAVQIMKSKGVVNFRTV
ncbi:MAG: site-specific DNA-methyltransferase [Bacteroidales bacterium]|nr:site-specific DNA-methyltransferase [Bacteroidales bacterium]